MCISPTGGAPRVYGKQNGGGGEGSGGQTEKVTCNKQILTSAVAALADGVKGEKIAAGQCGQGVVCPLCSKTLEVCCTKEAYCNSCHAGFDVFLYVSEYVGYMHVCIYTNYYMNTHWNNIYMSMYTYMYACLDICFPMDTPTVRHRCLTPTLQMQFIPQKSIQLRAARQSSR